MEIKWKEALWKAASEIMIKGGKLEFFVYRREPGNKRLPVIHIYPDNRITCKEETIVD